MPLDALCVSALRKELVDQIKGKKIDKIQQPERDVLILSFRGTSLRPDGGQTLRLLISVGADDARVHLTEFKFDNPKAPPMFCMLLRKHITGARVIDIEQPPSERVLVMRLETSSAMGVQSEKCLIIEMIGRLSNIILKDNDGIIIDCSRRIGGEMTGKRSVLPGLLYRNPPPQERKLDPLNVTVTEFKELLKISYDSTIEKWLISRFTAISPLICREIAWRAYGETDHRIEAIIDDGEALVREFIALVNAVKEGNFEPWLLLTEADEPKDFSFTRIGQYENACKSIREESFSQLLDIFFTRSELNRRISQRSAATLKLMTTARDRLIRKLSTQRIEINEAAKGDKYRECGDMITANLHIIKRGQVSLIAEDFYSEKNELREIKLDPLLTPQQNAAKYYKNYTKSKNAGSKLTEQIKKGEMELDYVTSVIDQIKMIENEKDLNEIRNELVLTGYIKSSKQQKTKEKESTPFRFKSTSGMLILVGRSNIQNDKLTLKTAARSDIWFHAQKIHGAHVIVCCAGSSPDDQTITEAAAIAGFYSAARADGKVPVDYTLVKNVKKPPGGRPGAVIYNDYKTILAKPDEELVKQLRENN